MKTTFVCFLAVVCSLSLVFPMTNAYFKAGSTENGCNNVVGVDVGNKRYYVERNYKTNFFGAVEQCASLGMRLATIMSKEEDITLVSYIKTLHLAGQYFWISGSDLANQGIYTWLSTGEQIIYSNFWPGEPSNAAVKNNKEQCLHLWNKSGTDIKWNDLACTRANLFVCEYILSNDKQTGNNIVLVQ